ncbi:hypothetical protein [Natrinema sp. SYSU A 869]|uniref:hypothetical protein n=1 Tax=Natrinema sp. SYSU A 869 TaxID=2871694 RepID=UPI001CA44979|nr:hypothetical protein [Natrinema sp. SYSU A 869]
MPLGRGRDHGDASRGHGATHGTSLLKRVFPLSTSTPVPTSDPRSLRDSSGGDAFQYGIGEVATAPERNGCGEPGPSEASRFASAEAGRLRDGAATRRRIGRERVSGSLPVDIVELVPDGDQR